MKLSRWIWGIAAVSAGMLIYGALVESNNLTLEPRKLRLPNWPRKLNGFKIAVIADLHVRDQWSFALAKRAIAMALATEPDMVVMPGDFVAYISKEALELTAEVLAPLRSFDGKVLASLGNHDLEYRGTAELERILQANGIRVLRNESVELDGIIWVGIDSATEGLDDQQKAMEKALASDKPTVVLWHEPDMCDELVPGASLMISGHSHGGQFRFPGGFTPMHTKLGEKYPRGYYPHAPTPLYVSRGVGTTGPPSRFNCAPEVSLLVCFSLD